MFGYVRPFRPYLRVAEDEGYKSVYCALCKNIGREFGLVPRFALSYDLTFLSIMDMSVNGIELKAARQHCIAHPVRRRSCAACSRSSEYAAFVSVMLVYHKLRDDLADGSLKGRLRARALLPFFTKPYIKARGKYPALAAKLEKAMKLQGKLEKAGETGVDAACEPTARMMQAVFSGIAEDREKRRLLGRFGYFLGKYIYLTDALDDLRRDAESGQYNPLLGSRKRGKLSDGEHSEIAGRTQFLVNMVLGQLAEAYVKLDIKMYSGIIDNIVYLGLPDVFRRVREERFSISYRPGKEDDK